MERETVKIENKDNKRTGFSIIAKDDFIEGTHKLYSEKAEKPKAEEKPEPKAKKPKAKKDAK